MNNKFTRLDSNRNGFGAFTSIEYFNFRKKCIKYQEAIYYLNVFKKYRIRGDRRIINRETFSQGIKN